MASFSEPWDHEDLSAFCRGPVNWSQYSLLRDRSLLHARHLIPYQVFIGLIVVVGLVGNVLVIVVNGNKQPKTSSTQFILFMAITDMFAITVVISFLLMELYRHYVYYEAILCKLYEWCKHSVITVSVCSLICIAFDRYIAIRDPLNFRAYEEKTKFLIAGCVVVGFGLQVPCLFLFGHRTYVLAQNLTAVGCGCGVVDEYRGRAYHRVFRAYLFVIYVLGTIVIVTLYTKMYVLFYTREQQLRRRSSSLTSSRGVTISDEILSAQIENSQRSGRARETRSCWAKVCPTLYKLVSRQAQRVRPERQQQNGCDYDHHHHHLNFALIARFKLGKLLLIVTLTFLITWLPHWIVVLASTRHSHWWRDLPYWKINILIIFRNLYFVNNAVNPIIYAIHSKDFRTRLAAIIRR